MKLVGLSKCHSPPFKRLSGCLHGIAVTIYKWDCPSIGLCMGLRVRTRRAVTPRSPVVRLRIGKTIYFLFVKIPEPWGKKCAYPVPGHVQLSTLEFKENEQSLRFARLQLVATRWSGGRLTAT